MTGGIFPLYNGEKKGKKEKKEKKHCLGYTVSIVFRNEKDDPEQGAYAGLVSRQIALDQLVRGTAQPIMSRAQLQRVPCYGQIAEPVTATGEVIESPEDFDTMLQGNKFGKKDMLQKMCEMHHIATRQGTVKYSTFVTNGNNGIGRHFTRL